MLARIVVAVVLSLGLAVGQLAIGLGWLAGLASARPDGTTLAVTDWVASELAPVIAGALPPGMSGPDAEQLAAELSGLGDEGRHDHLVEVLAAYGIDLDTQAAAQRIADAGGGLGAGLLGADPSDPDAASDLLDTLVDPTPLVPRLLRAAGIAVGVWALAVGAAMFAAPHWSRPGIRVGRWLVVTAAAQLIVPRLAVPRLASSRLEAFAPAVSDIASAITVPSLLALAAGAALWFFAHREAQLVV